MADDIEIEPTVGLITEEIPSLQNALGELYGMTPHQAAIWTDKADKMLRGATYCMQEDHVGVEHDRPTVNTSLPFNEQADMVVVSLMLHSLRAWLEGPNTPGLVFKGKSPKGTPSLVCLSKSGKTGEMTVSKDLASLAEQVVCFKSPKGDKGALVHKGAPNSKLMAKINMAIDELPFPELKDVISTPQWHGLDTEDPILQASAGFDPATGIYQSKSWSIRRKAKPTAGDIENAKAFIDGFFGEFPYADEASRTNTVALLVTAALRTGLPPTCPVTIVTANDAGSGKTLLAELVSTLALGESPSPITRVKNADWNGKQFTMVLRDTKSSFIWFDESDAGKSPLDGAVRAAVTAASGETKDRAAYGAELITLSTARTFVFTGNNLHHAIPREDMRRAVMVQLHLVPADTFSRDEGDLRKDAMSSVGAFHQHVATLVDAWIAAGRPMPDDQMPSFNEWLNIVGGILQVAGYTDLRKNAEVAVARFEQGVGEFRKWVHDNVAPEREVGPIKIISVEGMTKALAARPANVDVLRLTDELNMSAPTDQLSKLWSHLTEVIEVGNAPGIKRALSAVLGQAASSGVRIYSTVLLADGSVIRMQRAPRGSHGRGLAIPVAGFLFTTDPTTPFEARAVRASKETA